ncbi:MAG: preprotein translocase subunit SecG [Bacteroidaceae bacterium]|nr:preprotein translocase subunit SecG [Bacteroidaceae bacterium]
MYVILIVLIVLTAILLCGVVMVQNSKGGGLASSFASSNQIMGVRKTTDFLEKFTWGCAAVLVVLSVATAYVLPHATMGAQSVFENEAQQENVVNPLTAPGFDAPAESSAETPATEVQE